MNKLCDVCMKKPWTIQHTDENDSGVHLFHFCKQCYEDHVVKEHGTQPELFSHKEMQGFIYE